MKRIYPVLFSCLAILIAGCSSVEVYQEDDYDADYDYICSNNKTVTLTDSNGNTYTIPACNEADVIRPEDAPQKMTVTRANENIVEEESVATEKNSSFWSRLWGSSEEEISIEQEKEIVVSSNMQEVKAENINNKQPAIPEVLQKPVEPDEECIVKMYDYDIEQKYAVGEKMPKNKHKKQIMLEDLNTRMVVFCRGTEEQMEACAENMTYAGYVRISQIPRVAAKYDVAPQRGYPARRWREGDVVPRW